MTDYSDPTTYIVYAAFWLIALSIAIVLIDKKKYEKHHKLVFMLFVIPAMLSTLYLGGHTVYKNLNSETNGPIHWHADFQVWTCGERLDLVNPRGLRNKIGDPLFHEHNDDRIHVEGTVANIQDIDFDSFFTVVGGELTNNKISYDVEGEGLVTYETGDNCGNQRSELAVYVNGKRIKDVTNYMYYPHPLVPPGDCVIVEFGPNLGKSTEKICDSWAAQGWSYDNYQQKREDGNYAPWSSKHWDYEEKKGYEVVN